MVSGAIYRARIHATARKSTLALRQRKRWLVAQLQIFPDCLRASLVERFSRCGKSNCRCHHGGDKHGPFYFLTQCLAVGKINKFLLKTQPQQQAAKEGIAHYRQLHEQIEELSQLNAELLRRGERLTGE
ncbi:MAG: DUF6788 family protein [Limisphaerales bacterium]